MGSSFRSWFGRQLVLDGVQLGQGSLALVLEVLLDQALAQLGPGVHARVDLAHERVVLVEPSPSAGQALSGGHWSSCSTRRSSLLCSSLAARTAEISSSISASALLRALSSF